MLVIRSQQLRVFADAVEDQFIEQSVEYVRATWPRVASNFKDGRDLRKFVSDSIQRGRELGFEQKGHFRQILDWECELGLEIHQDSPWDWLRDFLKSDLPLPTRIFRIQNRLKAWREAGCP